MLRPDLAEPAIDQGPDLYGAVIVGGLTLAVPIRAICEVVPRPRALLPFPASRDDILGAIDLRGRVIPVLDPVPLLHVTDAGACAVVLILRDQDRVLGVAIDGIAGVVSLRASDLTLLQASQAPQGQGQGDGHGQGGPATLMRAGFVREDTRGMVLDPHALAGLDGMPLSVERTVASVDHGAATGGVPTLLFTVGTVRLGLAARAIEASVPEQAIVPSPIADDFWCGTLTHNGCRVPVVDTLRLLQLGACEPRTRTAAVIVRLPDRRLVGLQIDAVDDMRRIVESDIRPLQHFAVGNARLFAGLYGTDEPSLVLASDAVQADDRLAVVSRLYDPAEMAGQAERDHLQTLRAFLIVRLGKRRLAIPLDQIEEIIPTRVSGIGLADPAQAIVDFAIHRGRGVPLVDLRSALGQSPEQAAREARRGAFTVLASLDGNQAGFIVDELCAVERSPVQLLRDTGSDRAMGRIAATIKTADGACSVIDLHLLIGALVRLDPAEAAGAAS